MRPMDDPFSRAVSLEREGLALQDLGSLPEALGCFQRMLEALRAWDRQARPDADAAPYVVHALLRCGSVLRRMDRAGEALPLVKEAFRIAEREARRHPSDPEIQRDLSLACDALGDTLRDLGRDEAAAGPALRSLRIARGLLATAPSDRRLRHDVAASLQRLAWSYWELRRTSEAVPLLMELVAILEGLADERPSDPEALPSDLAVQRFLASGYTSLGDLLAALDRHAEAAVCLERAVERYRLVLERDGASPEIHHELAGALRHAGEVEARRDDPDGAVGLLREAVAEARRASAGSPGSRVFGWGLVHAHFALAMALQKTGREAAAHRHAFRAQSIQRRLTRRPANRD